jgi:hypothetical protein
MGWIYAPPATGPSFQVVNSVAQVNAYASAASAGVPANGINNFGFGPNPTLGTGTTALSLSTPVVGSIVRQENYGSSGLFGYGGSGVPIKPFLVGNAPNTGGFYLEIYAGIGDRLDTSCKPAYFIGLSSSTVDNSPFSTNIVDAVGLIIDSSGVSTVFPWQWIYKRGAGTPVLTPLGFNAAIGQLFALQFKCPPNSDAIVFTVKRLTAPGVWSTIVPAFNLAGLGPAPGTRLGPQVYGQCTVTAGTGSSIILHRMLGLTDQYSVGSAFPSG